MEILVDNPPSVRDVPLAMKAGGYEVGEPMTVEGGWKLTVKV